jgi:hypothetical protein
MSAYKPAVPHLTIKREGSSWDGWCVHYLGFHKPGIGEGRITHCGAGVEYDSVCKRIEYTYSYGDGHKYPAHKAYPCFRREHQLTDGCSKCLFPTPEEIKAHADEATGHIKNMISARAAIVDELERRNKDGDVAVKLNRASQSEYDDGGPTNYVSGAGIIGCPICKTGKLRYSRAAYNGHVHARCSTDGCVSWME